MNDLLISDDWRKQASAQPDSSVQPAEEVEKAFLDQAYMHIQNKATPLMKQQFRVGFEVVHKNDENTRMVGVFVFRVGDQFFYAPVFFLNGAIKGTDLLYRANVKRFVPLNNEWCEYLINLSTMDEGHGVSIRERQLTRDQLNLLDVVEPPQMFRYRRKYSSADERNKVLKEIEDMLEKAAQIPAPGTGSILRKFITEYGGFNAIKKIANTAKHDRDFAQALLVGSHPDNYMPQLPPHPPGYKAATRTPLLVLHTSVLRNQNVKKASVQEMCAGYKLEDFRKEGDANDVVYTDNTADVHSVEAPGVYSILMADGSSRKMLVAFYQHLGIASCAPPKATYASSYDPPHNRRRSVCLIDVESGKSDDHNMDVNRQEWVFGTYEGDLKDNDKLKKLEDAATGKAYRIYDSKAESFSEPFYVVSKEKSEGGLDALRTSSWDPGTAEGTILINPEYADYDPQDNIFGSRCKVVEVEHTIEDSGNTNKRIRFGRPEGIGNKNTLNAFIFECNFKRGSVQMQEVSGETQFLVRTARTENKWTNGLSKLSAKIRLMTDCMFREETAEDVIKMASEAPKKTYHFFYDSTEKLAHNVRFNDWPEFYERQNNEFNVLEQPRTNWIMESEFDRPIHMPHRVGDVWSQDSSESLDTMTPMQLYDKSKQRGVGNMFEHGVVGELVKTYDSNQLIQSYVADLELALDRVGRIIFLFYWKPEDFAASYGSDDQTALENKFLSNFKSLGEMTLELLQKAKLQQEGTPSLT